MRLRSGLTLVALLAVLLVVLAACSSGSPGTASTTGGQDTHTVTTQHSTDTGSVDTGSVSTGSVDTGSGGDSGSSYCRAARTYDADLAHFSADDTAAVNLAVKDVTDLHNKAPKVIKQDYAIVLATLKEVQESGPDAPTSDELSVYQDSFGEITEYDHTHCGLPAYH